MPFPVWRKLYGDGNTLSPMRDNALLRKKSQHESAFEISASLFALHVEVMVGFVMARKFPKPPIKFSPSLGLFAKLYPLASRFFGLSKIGFPVQRGRSAEFEGEI